MVNEVFTLRLQADVWFAALPLDPEPAREKENSGIVQLARTLFHAEPTSDRSTWKA